MTAIDTADLRASAGRLFRRKQLAGFGLLAGVILYLAYAAVAFDIAGLMGRARWDNAVVLASDTWSYKTHVERQHRSGDIEIAIEGERRGTYAPGTSPDWIVLGDTVTVDLGHGATARLLPGNVTELDIPGHGTARMALQGRSISGDFGEVPPDWISASAKRVMITLPGARVTMTPARTEIFRYFFGWDLFWFTLDSPYFGHGPAEILFGPRIDPQRGNIAGAAHDWWTNAVWHHKDVAWAIGETILMAFLGTFGAAIAALPLAFLAARNFTPVWLLRGAVRRVFDFIRGVDSLIWTIVLARAFGPGPLTGALAILVTDTGTFGKVFSEALENIDGRQVEGIRSTGANAVQRARFGVLPQLVPVLLSQVLYFLESNTRSATVIGAITGGGIGLLLTQAMQTQKDWEEVSYYILLIVLMVMAMDWLSGRLRARLIGRGSAR
ncbi:phosphonate ABC transporter, permease protein PhnE [Poseidonocella sp. HB161398]|uniref:phosphonate ABC transporter, permease protein PhnE n=1 Tax=Poseidonocella sp. HB161398 TaxID=2320855 RepID=UPI001107ADD1|nr:phosphonate ABC transporter, permease protein PhnE [Poseidonocella sp. HB161398]